MICAHNYRTHFGSLRNLKEGDQVMFKAMNGVVFPYEVAFCHGDRQPPSRWRT